jgi:hypothetical protein
VIPARRLAPLLALPLWLAGCGGPDLHRVPGSTLRVGEPRQEEGTELDLHIFTQASQCGNLSGAEPESCLPWVDRASGEVHLAFQFRAGTDPWPMAIEREHLQVVHQGSLILEGQNQQSYEIIPHAPQKTEQLFVVLIDGSGSMNEPAADPKIQRVRKALLQPEVVQAFFPGDGTTGLLLLEFSGTQVRPVGGEMRILQRRQDYRQLVRDSLRASGGYTNLYQAIDYATGELLREVPEVVEFLRTTTGAPTVIALTDGFNNERWDDTCGTNAARLQRLLARIEDARGEGSEMSARPRVFTVGLGRPTRRRFQLPEALDKVKPAKLCGEKHRDMRIDGHLETLGIDNASLAWIAEVGGGDSFVKQKADGLGQAFQAAAAEQYEWFEVRYRLDPFYLRRSFETRLRLAAFAEAEASVRLHPSAWLDTPPGERAADGWSRRSSLARSAALVMPLLGLLVALSFLSPALLNARRIVFGRLRPPRAPAAPVASPEAPAGPPGSGAPGGASSPLGTSALPGGEASR